MFIGAPTDYQSFDPPGCFDTLFPRRFDLLLPNWI